MRHVYLDTNMLVAYFATGKKAEADRKKEILKAFKVLLELADVKLSLSMWTVTEMVQILINQKGMGRKKVAEIANNLLREIKMEGLEIKIVSVSPRDGYTFDDFFYDVREKMILYNPGWGDAIHGVIMRNNGIKEILTFDGKDDFKIMPGLTVIHPKDVAVEPV